MNSSFHWQLFYPCMRMSKNLVAIGKKKSVSLDSSLPAELSI
jgi:hypothetical protein